MVMRIVGINTLVLLLAALQIDVVAAQDIRPIPNLDLLRLKASRGDLPHNNLVRNTFTPPLKKVLHVELHFLKKICDPTEEQFAAIHRAGLDEVNELAQLYAVRQRVRSRTQGALDPNARIASALSEAVSKIIPDREIVQRYRDEINAREEARRGAAVGMMVTLVDQLVFLGPQQQDRIAEALLENWDPKWSSAPIVVMYPMYSSLPSEDVLSSHLTPVQQKLWAYRPAQRSVRLPWDFELNVGKMLGVEAFEAFPDPPPDPPLEPFPDPAPFVEEAGR